MTPPPPAPNPYAPPQAPYGAYAPGPGGPPGYEEPRPRVDGNRVTIGKTYQFPPMCVKCGATGELRGRAQQFAWFPAWTYFLILLGLLPMIIVQMVTTKRARLWLPLCVPCHSRWTTARVLRSLSVLGPIVLGLALAFVGVAYDSTPVTVTGVLLIFPGLFAVVPVDLLLVRRWTLRPVFADDRVITLKGVAPQVLDVMRQG